MTVAVELQYGALVAMSIVASLFFLRYWRLTRDWFFVWFASAFGTFAINWALLACLGSEQTHFVFLVRLAGFIQIGVAVLQKNRASRRG